MTHEDQTEFYECPLCGSGTGNDIDGTVEHKCEILKELPIQKESEWEVKCTCPSDPGSPIKRVWTEDEIKKVKYCPKHGSTKESDDKCREVAQKIVDLTGYGQALHVNDILPDLRELLSNREKEIADEVEKARKELLDSDESNNDTFNGSLSAYDEVLQILKH